MEREVDVRIQKLEQRLASWKNYVGPQWIMDAAPKVIADLEAELAALAHQDAPHDR